MSRRNVDDLLGPSNIADEGQEGMLPEVADAIAIADKHLSGESIERRRALTHDITAAIIRHAGNIACAAIKTAFEKAKS